MQYDETRKLLELAELLEWFNDQGYGDSAVWDAVRLVRRECANDAIATIKLIEAGRLSR